jgi:hypothetical protein
MKAWRWTPHWQVFEMHGIDVSTMQPLPLQGPPFTGDPVANPEPTPWQVQKQLNRLHRKLRQVDERRQDRSAVQAGMEELRKAWKPAQHDNIHVYSR